MLPNSQSIRDIAQPEGDQNLRASGEVLGRSQIQRASSPEILGWPEHGTGMGLDPKEPQGHKSWRALSRGFHTCSPADVHTDRESQCHIRGLWTPGAFHCGVRPELQPWFRIQSCTPQTRSKVKDDQSYSWETTRSIKPSTRTAKPEEVSRIQTFSVSHSQWKVF